MGQIKLFIKRYGLLLLLAVYEAAMYLIWNYYGNTFIFAEASSAQSLLLAWVLLAPIIVASWYIATKYPEQPQVLKNICRPVWRVLSVILALITVSSLLILLFPGIAV